MEIFKLTLNQMLMMFSLILVGFLLRKCRVLPEEACVVLSKAETFVFVPALTLYNQLNKCTVATFTANSTLIPLGFLLVGAAILLAYPLSRLFVRPDGSPTTAYRRNIYKYALTFGNYGFTGNFIVLGVWGEDMFYRYSLLVFGVGLLCSSWGLYILIPKEHNAGLLQNLKKGLLTPPMLALAVGMAGGLLGLGQHIPAFAMSALESAGNCMGPVAMVLAGLVIGGYRLRDLLADKKVYLATALRLVVIPAAILTVLKLLGVTEDILALTLIAFGTPLGLNTIVYPAAYGGETKTGASMAMISHTLSVATIPLLYLLFIQWL